MLVSVCATVAAAYAIGVAKPEPGLTMLLLAGLVWLVTGIARRVLERSSNALLIERTRTGRTMRKELLDMLPEWVTFPDTERADWMNAFIVKYWPFLLVATEDTMKKLLNPILASHTHGTPIRWARFTRFSLGSTPLNVSGVRCHTRGAGSEIVLDFDVRMAGQPDVQLEVGAASFACVPVALAELQVVGTLRVIFTPLCTVWPCFAGLSVGFVRKPRVDCRLTVVASAFDVMAMPGVSDALLTLISQTLASHFTWPNFQQMRILDGDYGTDPDLPVVMAMAGVLEVELQRVSGLKRPPADTPAAAVVSHPGRFAMRLLACVMPIWPYATTSLSSTEPIRYPTVMRRKCGELDVLTELIVDHAPQEGEQLNVRIFDDQLSDLLLGSCVLDLAQVASAPNASLDKSLPLVGGAPGMRLQLRAQWRPFPPPAGARGSQEPPPKLERRSSGEGAADASNDEAPDYRVSRRSLRAGRTPSPAIGVLTVRLRGASELVADDFGGTSDPYAELSVGDCAPVRSKVVRKTTSPRWDERFRFVVRDLEVDSLFISLWDHDQLTRHDALGEVRLKLSDLAQQTRTHGTYAVAPPEKARHKAQRHAHYGHLTLTTFWRELVHVSELITPNDPAPEHAASAARGVHRELEREHERDGGGDADGGGAGGGASGGQLSTTTPSSCGKRGSAQSEPR